MGRGVTTDRTRQGRRCGTGGGAVQGAVDWFGTLVWSLGQPADPGDIRYRLPRGKIRELLLVLLDSSGSTLRGQSLATAKGIVAALIEAAYCRRSRIGIIQFAGKGAQLRLPPGRAPRQVQSVLATIKGGGGTPLGQGLRTAARVLQSEHERFPQERQILVLITDGRSRDDVDSMQIPCRTLVVDTESGPIRLGRCWQLAQALQGEYISLVDLPVRLATR